MVFIFTVDSFILTYLQGPMFGGMPGMFGPIMMGGGGGGVANDLIMNQQRPIQDPFPPPLPMNALPGKVIK